MPSRSSAASISRSGAGTRRAMRPTTRCASTPTASAAAREHVFMANQYFSSRIVAEALAARLAETRGPDLVLVSHRTESGWLEASTMGVLRARVHRRIATRDARSRFRAYSPDLPG